MRCSTRCASDAAQPPETEQMFLALFDLFRIGFGPSSSQIMGPMMFGGKRHLAGRAQILGPAGLRPESVKAKAADRVFRRADDESILTAAVRPDRSFDPDRDFVLAFGERLPGHTSGMLFEALDATGRVLAAKVYYSMGGGFVLTAEAMELTSRQHPHSNERVPYAFTSAAQMLGMSRTSGFSNGEMESKLDAGLAPIRTAMRTCIDRRLGSEGVLPGGLGLRRRTRPLAAAPTSGRTQPNAGFDRVAACAIAVNEENAAGGQVATAPNNGAAENASVTPGWTRPRRWRPRDWPKPWEAHRIKSSMRRRLPWSVTAA